MIHRLSIVALLFIFSTEAFSQWQATGLTSGLVKGLTMDANALYTCTYGSGVSRTSDGGTNRQSRNGSLFVLTMNAVITDGTRLFAAITSNQGIFRSTDQGQNWSAVNSGLGNKIVYALGYNADKSVLLAGSGSGAYRTTDGGDSWSSAGLNGKYVYGFTNIGSTMFAATWGSGVFKSTDNGQTWTAASTGLPVNIQAVYAKGNTLFAGVVSQKVYRSTDNGDSWSMASEGTIPADASCFVGFGNSIFAGTPLGVFRSTDDGITWSSVSEGISANQTVFALIVRGNYIYAGLYGDGVWKRSLADFGLAAVEEQASVPNTLLLYKNYPNPFNPSSTISYSLMHSGHVQLRVFNALGQEVSTLVNTRQEAGRHEVTWNASAVPSGVYYYRLETDGKSAAGKMLLTK